MPNDVARPITGQEDVERRAYELYERRGSADGRDWDDWFQAEREIRGVEAANAATVTASPRARRRRAARELQMASQ